jgi:hypothetical protein
MNFGVAGGRDGSRARGEGGEEEGLPFIGEGEATPRGVPAPRGVPPPLPPSCGWTLHSHFLKPTHAFEFPLKNSKCYFNKTIFIYFNIC